MDEGHFCFSFGSAITLRSGLRFEVGLIVIVVVLVLVVLVTSMCQCDYQIKEGDRQRHTGQ